MRTPSRLPQLTICTLVAATVTFATSLQGRAGDGPILFNSASSEPEQSSDIGATGSAGKSEADRNNEPDPATDAKSVPTTAKQFSRSPLVSKVRRVLDDYYLKPLSSRDETPWSVLHWSIAFGVDSNLRAGDATSQSVSAIGWLCVNNPCAGQRLIVDRGERFELPVAAGVQGHEGQFLAMLAQSRVKRDYLLRLGKRELSVADLIDYEKRTCRKNVELTFKLIGLAHYEGTEAKWKNTRGEEWSVKRLLTEELQQPISAKEATCGGLHRLFAISYAAECRRREKQSITDEWKTAADRTARFQRRAFELQNNDGSFSTAWLDRRENRDDITRRLTTSGHILEWLASSLPEEQISDSRFERAIDYVATLLDGKQDTPWHRGAMGHALHALVIYEQRVCGAEPGDRTTRLADHDASTYQ